ncbi:MAG: hypothetical protein ACO1RT_18145, partial [Planctomycetaceae bacterium]
SAIIVEAGEGKEDRLMSGSYRELRSEEARLRAASHPPRAAEAEYFVPDDSTPSEAVAPTSDDPFGVSPDQGDTKSLPVEADPFGLGL